MDKKELVERCQRAVSLISDDISDRSRMGDEWDMCDDDIKQEIENEWVKIIFNVMKGE